MYNPEMELQLVAMREVMPRLWRAIYLGSTEAGFSEAESFALLTAYIVGLATTIRPDNPPHGKEDKHGSD